MSRACLGVEGLPGVAGGKRMSEDVFVWTWGTVHLTVAQEGDSWAVIYKTESPLLGANPVTYESRHRQPTHAAWDVLARVSRVTHDDEVGVHVAQQAARWMRSIMGAAEAQPVQAC